MEAQGNRLKCVEHGVIKASRTIPLSECLHKLGTGISGFIERSKPDAVAIEGVFFCKNVKTVLMLGEARGVVIAACAASGLPVFSVNLRLFKKYSTR